MTEELPLMIIPRITAVYFWKTLCRIDIVSDRVVNSNSNYQFQFQLNVFNSNSNYAFSRFSIPIPITKNKTNSNSNYAAKFSTPIPIPTKFQRFFAILKFEIEHLKNGLMIMILLRLFLIHMVMIMIFAKKSKIASFRNSLTLSSLPLSTHM